MWPFRKEQEKTMSKYYKYWQNMWLSWPKICISVQTDWLLSTERDGVNYNYMISPTLSCVKHVNSSITWMSDCLICLLFSFSYFYLCVFAWLDSGSLLCATCWSLTNWETSQSRMIHAGNFTITDYLRRKLHNHGWFTRETSQSQIIQDGGNFSITDHSRRNLTIKGDSRGKLHNHRSCTRETSQSHVMYAGNFTITDHSRRNFTITDHSRG